MPDDEYSDNEGQDSGAKVMIPDEHGVLRPWTVILKPTGLSTQNLQAAMGLSADPDDETDAAGELYREIRRKVKFDFIAAMPNVADKPVRWDKVPTNVKFLVNESVVVAKPYMRRFPGGWATEAIMQDILRNFRDTESRRRTGKLGPRGKKMRAQSAPKSKSSTQSRVSTNAAAASHSIGHGNASVSSAVSISSRSANAAPNTEVDNDSVSGNGQNRNAGQSNRLGTGISVSAAVAAIIGGGADQESPEDGDAELPGSFEHNSDTETQSMHKVPKQTPQASKRIQKPTNNLGIPQPKIQEKASPDAPTPDTTWDSHVDQELEEIRTSKPSRAGRKRLRAESVPIPVGSSQHEDDPPSSSRTKSTNATRPRPKMRPVPEPEAVAGPSNRSESIPTKRAKQELIDRTELASTREAVNTRSAKKGKGRARN